MDIAKIRKKLKDSEPANEIPEEKQGEQKDVPAWEENTEAVLTDSSASEKLQEEIKEKNSYYIKKEKEKNKEKNPAAGIKGDEAGQDEIIEILTFRLLHEDFAFRISQLKEILKFQRITSVPKVPDYVLGITSLRGKVIPVIDLRAKIFPENSAPLVTDKIKILIIKGPKGMIGAVVDRVTGVVRIAKSEIVPPPSHLSDEQARFIEGMAVIDKRFISIVNMDEAVSIQLN